MLEPEPESGAVDAVDRRAMYRMVHGSGLSSWSGARRSGGRSASIDGGHICIWQATALLLIQTSNSELPCTLFTGSYFMYHDTLEERPPSPNWCM